MIKAFVINGVKIGKICERLHRTSINSLSHFTFVLSNSFSIPPPPRLLTISPFLPEGGNTLSPGNPWTVCQIGIPFTLLYYLQDEHVK